MRRAVAMAALAALTLFCGRPGFAQQPSGEIKKELDLLKEGQAKMQRDLDLKKDIEALKAGQARIEKELQDLKGLLQARPAPSPGQPSAGPAPTVVLSVDGAPFKGDKNAKLTLVDFTDYQ